MGGTLSTALDPTHTFNASDRGCHLACSPANRNQFSIFSIRAGHLPPAPAYGRACLLKPADAQPRSTQPATDPSAPSSRASDLDLTSDLTRPPRCRRRTRRPARATTPRGMSRPSSAPSATSSASRSAVSRCVFFLLHLPLLPSRFPPLSRRQRRLTPNLRRTMTA